MHMHRNVSHIPLIELFICLCIFCFLKELPNDLSYDCDVGRLLENKKKNRFVNIIACKYQIKTYSGIIFLICYIQIETRP